MTNTGHKLGLGIDFGMPEVPVDERISAISAAGFDAAFTGWKPGDYCRTLSKKLADAGLIYQSVHAPFKRVNKLWEVGEEADAALAELCNCLHDTADAGVPIMVCHVWIGFGEEHPNEIGVENYAKLLETARTVGVNIAFENTEGEGYLERLRDELFDHPNAGFCIDTGHEMCYNRSNDMIGKYGRGAKLIATHLNDNLAITGDSITWLDDAHLLPFDGVADWNGVARRLVGVGYDGILTSELTVKSKPGRTANDRYATLDCPTYVAEAYRRAAKVAALMDKYSSQS